MPRHLANLAFAAIFLAFLALHLYRLGAVSITWDEGGDLAIIECMQAKGTAFACLQDISQTRLPYFIHAFVAPAYGDERAHYRVSVVFSAATLLMIYLFARRTYGAGVATLAAGLYVTSPQLLASGRMLLTHSNIIFTFFSTASFLSIFQFAKTGKRRWIVVCALASGASAASSALGPFNGAIILAVYLAARRYAWRDLVYFPIAAATFFATSVIYVRPELFAALVKACMLGEIFPFWNYFQTGSNTAPWWFPWVVLVTKVGPWWLLAGVICWIVARRELRDRSLAAFAIGFVVILVCKGFVFHYDAPHQQVQFYPVLYVALAVAIVRAWRPWVLVAIAACFSIQLADVVRFFPHYLFYGSQYGERFIGEFYGPAVMHGQGKDPVVQAIDRIRATHPGVQILAADHNMIEHPALVKFTQRDPRARYDFAVVDRLYATHFRMPERDAYNAFLAQHYKLYYTTYFPPRVWMYRIYRLR